MSNKFCVIFDLDGTLLDTLEDIADSLNLVLERNGLKTHPIESYKRFVGDGIKNLVIRATRDYALSDENLLKLVEELKIEYHNNLINKTQPYPGIIELINQLSEMNISLNILSNKPDNYTKLLYEKFFNTYNFSYVLGENNNFRKKPEPDAINDIIKNLNIENDRVLFVGDTSTDIIAAKNAGIKSVGVLWGFRDEKELKEAGADFIISKPQELLEIINNLMEIINK